MSVRLLTGVIERHRERHAMTDGPRCDYQDCPRHKEITPGHTPNRNRYCTIECRNDEIKRRLVARGHTVKAK